MSNLDKLQQLNTNKPRETLVVAADGLVFKRPVIAPGALPAMGWIEKQKLAQTVQEELQPFSGRTYFIPRMLEISEKELFAVEERVPGHPLTSAYFDTLSPADQEIIYHGIANFLNDMHQMRPILTQRDTFDVPEHPGDVTFARILKHMKPHLSSKEFDTLKKAKEWFDNASANSASVVFCQGDMNEHNIFYDPQTKRLSIIDFADARYENIRDMFERDWARLAWLDIEKLKELYINLPRRKPIIIKEDQMVARVRNELQNIKWTGAEILNSPPKLIPARVMMLKEQIKSIAKLYDTIKINVATNALKTINTKRIIDTNKKGRL